MFVGNRSKVSGMFLALGSTVNDLTGSYPTGPREQTRTWVTFCFKDMGYDLSKDMGDDVAWIYSTGVNRSCPARLASVPMHRSPK